MCTCISYLEMYQTDIAPKLMRIDVMLKTAEGFFTPAETADALCVTEDEVLSWMRRLGIRAIDRQAFLDLMRVCTSELCRLYQRELERGLSVVYTREDIAYIYQIDSELVERVCDRLKIREITAYTLPDVLSEINVYVTA